MVACVRRRVYFPREATLPVRWVPEVSLQVRPRIRRRNAGSGDFGDRSDTSPARQTRTLHRNGSARDFGDRWGQVIGAPVTYCFPGTYSSRFWSLSSPSAAFHQGDGYCAAPVTLVAERDFAPQRGMSSPIVQTPSPHIIAIPSGDCAEPCPEHRLPSVRTPTSGGAAVHEPIARQT